MLLIVNCPPWVKERRDADMGKITVAVIFGGQSSEHEVSRVSATTMISALRQEIYEVIPVGITKEGNWRIYHGPVEAIRNGTWEPYSTEVVLSPDASKKCLLKLVGGKYKEIPILCRRRLLPQ